MPWLPRSAGNFGSHRRWTKPCVTNHLNEYNAYAQRYRYDRIAEQVQCKHIDWVRKDTPEGVASLVYEQSFIHHNPHL